jgi:hypothetical protein
MFETVRGFEELEAAIVVKKPFSAVKNRLVVALLASYVASVILIVTMDHGPS